MATTKVLGFSFWIYGIVLTPARRYTCKEARVFERSSPSVVLAWYEINEYACMAAGYVLNRP